MSVTLPLIQEAEEGSQEAEARRRVTSPAGRYTVHLGLVVVALVVFLAGRVRLGWSGVKFDLPSTQAQVLVATPEAVVENVAPTPTAVATVVAENLVRRSAIPHTFEPGLPTHNFAEHTVESGDTPNKVAELYGIEPATLLWGNPDLSEKAQLLQVGITLTILPVNGVLHTVVESDTVESIAELYGVEPQVIIDYEDNHLAEWPHRPIPGTQLVVPGGEKDYLVWVYTPNAPRGRATTSSYYDGPIIYAGVGRFIWPTDSWRITQYFWWAHRAIDIGAATGTSVYASDGGTVIYAGWSTVGYGNHILIDHGNGFQTLYAHLSAIWVSGGQIVYQGTPIGAVGSTGNSSGPHLHFEIRYGGYLLNPLDYLWQ